MADPITLAAMASTVVTAGTSLVSADAEQKRGKANAEWGDRRALEERAVAQRGEAEEHRKATLAQSRLGAVAGASGSGASDKSVMDLFEGIQTEGDYNAATVKASGEQKASGIEYQSALDRWQADSNAQIKRVGAVGTLIGGGLDIYGGGPRSRMAAKYRDGSGLATGRSGYGS